MSRVSRARRTRRRPREEWLAFIPRAHEGYVSWEEFERIRETMAANLRGVGSGRGGDARPGAPERAAAVSTLWAEIDGLLHWHRSQCPALRLHPRRARQR